MSAFRHRNFRLFLVGQGTSVIGTWLTKFATSWMAYRLTGSAFVLGVVAFCNNAPTPLLAPIAGVLVDRWDRRKVVLATQIAALVQSAALAVFALTGTMTIVHLAVLGLVQAAINAFDMPARQSFLRQMIDDPADLPNAIALNSSMVNLGRLIGPVVAAVLVAAVGEGWCFAIDSASYLAVIASLMMMRIPHAIPKRLAGRARDQLRDGLAYVRSVPMIRAALALLAATSALGGAYQAMLPVVATENLGGGPHTLGILMGAAGVGALGAAVFLTVTARHDYAALIVRAVFGLGAALVGLELATSTWIAVPFLVVAGGCLMLQMAATNTIVQTTVDPARLGRVMSLYAVAFFGGMPIGAFLEGALASRIGAIHTMMIAGILCLGCATWFWRAIASYGTARVPAASVNSADVARGASAG